VNEDANRPAHYKRVLLKLSGEAFQDRGSGEPLNATVLRQNAEEIKKALSLDIEVAVVVGGGNIFRGAFGSDLGIGRTVADHIGMLGTVINALALQSALESLDVETRVMTAIEMPAMAEQFIRRRALRHLEKGRVVIFGAGTGNPYFTTDSAAALRANEIDCDVLLKATKVDGIYTSDPMKNPDAERYDRISYQDAIYQRLQIMDTSAFSLCMENSIPIIVFDFFSPDAFVKVLRGESSGTLVSH
jgi:uridylate kinase